MLDYISTTEDFRLVGQIKDDNAVMNLVGCRLLFEVKRKDANGKTLFSLDSAVPGEIDIDYENNTFTLYKSFMDVKDFSKGIAVYGLVVVDGLGQRFDIVTNETLEIIKGVADDE